MFCSHTLLVKKMRLRTVWHAADLQHKFNKSRCISIKISSAVEKIMYPRVNFELRISGHLLLGAVQIYSKQVDYFYEDCNVLRNKIDEFFPSVIINIPDDATHAPYHPITSPENFELDSLDLDDYGRCEDSHLKSHEDVTLTEQVPTGNDPYIDEHDVKASSFMEDNSGSGPIPVEEDVPPPVEVDNQLGANDTKIGSSTPQDLPSIEIMRDARHGFDFNNSPILPDRADPDEFLEEQINNNNKASAPVTEEVVLPDGHFTSAQNHEQQDLFGHLDSQMLFVHRSPEMEIQPTPQPKVRRRKRKQLYDESTVLSNEYMKNVLDDTSDIHQVKKNCPLSSLAIWKRNKRSRLRKDGILCETFIAGSCADLQDIYKEDFISAKFHLVTRERTHQETSDAQPPLSRRESEMENEVLRNNDCTSPERYLPCFSTLMPSPNGRSYFPPENSDLGLQSERLEGTEGDGIVLTTEDMGETSGGDLITEMTTPDTFYGKGLQAEHTAFSGIPEPVASAGELEFLEQDDNSPAGSQGTPEVGNNQGTPELAVVQYLKRHSLLTPILGNLEEE